MKHIFTLLMATLLCTGLHAQNSTLTIFITSTISGSTPVTISAVAPGFTDETVLDTVVAEFGESTVNYTFPDTTTTLMLTISWSCDGVPSAAIPFFVGDNMPGEPFDEEIAVEIGCQDTECAWYIDAVDPTNDLTSPTTFEVITEGSPAIYEWYVDGELVPPSTSTGGLIWSEPYETICAVMSSLGECTDPGEQCYDNPGNGGGGMNCLDGIDVGSLLLFLVENCADQTNLEPWVYCGLAESLTAAMNGDEEACAEIMAWIDAGGWESETPCDINFDIMQAWEANGDLIPNELWIWIYDYDSEYTYTFDFGDESPVTSEPNPTHTYSGNGPYLLTVTVSSVEDDCSATFYDTLSVDTDGMINGFMSGFTVNVMGAGDVVNSIEAPEWTDTFEVYPNPVESGRGQLMLRGIDGFRHFDSNQGNVRFKAELSTLTGERLILDTSGDVQNGRLRIPLGDIAPGLYLLLLENQGVGATRKVVIR
ncbi:MAG: PKD domain-containing protein [Flavobacteriales bacterium]|nr:PKD domain-containing protein [Flavobacteriales bacterium]